MNILQWHDRADQQIGFALACRLHCTVNSTGYAHLNGYRLILEELHFGHESQVRHTCSMRLESPCTDSKISAGYTG